MVDIPHGKFMRAVNWMSDLISRQDALAEFIDDRDVFDIMESIEELPSADRPKNMIHIDDVYRLIAGHSDYHGDSILSAFTCLVEGKDVKSIAPLDESADRPTGEWIEDKYCDQHCICSHCGGSSGTQFDGVQPIPLKTKFCPNCGADMNEARTDDDEYGQ